MALFDLDGTLTRHDTLLPFLMGYLAHHPARLLRLWRLVPALLMYALAARDRGRLKSRVIRAVMGGDPRPLIEAWAKRFVSDLTPKGAFHAAGLAALEEHRRAGDALVLLSASPDLYVPLIGALLRFDGTVCTEIRWDGERLDGALRTPNRRGEEKVRCLERLREIYPQAAVTAYGNSAAPIFPISSAVEPRHCSSMANSSARRVGSARVAYPTADWR